MPDGSPVKLRNPCRGTDDRPHSCKPLKLRAFTPTRTCGRERSCLRMTTPRGTRTIKGLIFKDCACRAQLTVQEVLSAILPTRSTLTRQTSE